MLLAKHTITHQLHCLVAVTKAAIPFDIEVALLREILCVHKAAMVSACQRFSCWWIQCSWSPAFSYLVWYCDMIMGLFSDRDVLLPSLCGMYCIFIEVQYMKGPGNGNELR